MWLSRATFISEAEVEHVLDELQAADALPDVVHVDGWLAGNVFQTFTCEWRGDHARFPNGWTDRLRRRGCAAASGRTPSSWRAARRARNCASEDCCSATWTGRRPRPPAATTEWIADSTNPQARDWWHERVAGLLAEEAPDALKLDFAEEIPLDAMTAAAAQRSAMPSPGCRNGSG